jgi:hypothetical protein
METGNVNHLAVYKTLRNMFNNNKRTVKKHYYDSLCDTIGSPNNKQGEFWKITNMSENKNDSLPPLINQNTHAYSDEEKVEMLNCYFCSMTNIDETNAVLPNFEPKTATSI